MPSRKRLTRLFADAYASLAHPSWDALLPRMPPVLRALARTKTPEAEYAPPIPRVFAALAVPALEVRVIVVGQDPYPTPGHASGRCFDSADPGQRPVSLARVLGAVHRVAGVAKEDLESSSLANWEAQGVLLLNAALTTRVNAPNAHPYWADFVDGVIRAALAQSRAAVVHILAWGRNAQGTVEAALAGCPRADREKACVHKWTHPVARAAFDPPVFAELPVDWRTVVPELVMFTDGSCVGENRRGSALARAGASCVIVRGPGVRGDDEAIERELAVPGDATNQRAELVALTAAYWQASRVAWRSCLICTDSQYALRLSVPDARGRVWTPKSNHELVDELRAAYAAATSPLFPGASLEVRHVRGHGKDPDPFARKWNDVADRVAVRVARR